MKKIIAVAVASAFAIPAFAADDWEGRPPRGGVSAQALFPDVLGDAAALWLAGLQCAANLPTFPLFRKHTQDSKNDPTSLSVGG
jgi:hypothetical protein